MKKLSLLILSFLMFQIQCLAQMFVDHWGNVGVSTPYGYLWSPLSINDSGTMGYAISCTGKKNGIYCKTSGTTSSIYGGDFCAYNSNGISMTGILGETDVTPQSTDSVLFSYGVKGIGGGARASNVGVYGTIDHCSKGIGVYGTIYPYESGNIFTVSTDEEKFAGYFHGNTMVQGYLTVSDGIQGPIIGYSLSGNRNSSLGNVSNVNLNVSGLLSGMYASQCTLEDNPFEEIEKKQEEEGFSISKEGLTRKQFFRKRHYVLSADKLEESFPDLVYEKDDGSKGINYIEMIPLLVQSINELSERIAELEGGNVAKPISKAPSTSSVARPSELSSAVLFQNKPNPFKEQTEIRFSIPQLNKNAFVCIFDMDGKMVRQIPIDSSMQSITINGHELEAGIYLYSLFVGGQEVDTKKMVISN